MKNSPNITSNYFGRPSNFLLGSENLTNLNNNSLIQYNNENSFAVSKTSVSIRTPTYGSSDQVKFEKNSDETIRNQQSQQLQEQNKKRKRETGENGVLLEEYLLENGNKILLFIIMIIILTNGKYP